MRDKEYDAFGPWILEINDEYPLPKKFEGYLDSRDEHELLIKIPRNIDRRDAHPGMELYEYVIALYKDNMCILKREDRGVFKKIIAYNQIQGIKNYENLLVGELTLCIQNKKVSIKYNTVSQNIIRKLISMIRNKYIDSNSYAKHEVLSDNIIDKLEIGFYNKLYYLKKYDNDLNIISIQPNSIIRYNNCNIFKRMYYRLLACTLQSSLYLSNQKEIIIMKKGENFLGVKQPDYSYSYTYIPYSNITGVYREEGKVTPEIERIIIKVDKIIFECLFKTDNKYKKILYDGLRHIC